MAVTWQLSRVKRTKPTPAPRLRARGGGGGDVAVVVSEKNKKPPPPRMQARGGGTNQREPLRLALEAREGVVTRGIGGGDIDRVGTPSVSLLKRGRGGGNVRDGVATSTK